jgi:ankyrin repeat protein
MANEAEKNELSSAMQALYTGGREAAEALVPADERLDVYEAAAFGRIDRLRDHLREYPAAANGFSPDGFTPLHLACFSGGAEAAQVLIEGGAELETLSQHATIKVRPLGTAVFSRDLESARVLLEAGADPNGRGEGGFRPLHTAATNGDLELIRLLLAHGADRSAALPDGRTPGDLARERAHEGPAAALREAGLPPYT